MAPVLSDKGLRLFLSRTTAARESAGGGPVEVRRGSADRRRSVRRLSRAEKAIRCRGGLPRVSIGHAVVVFHAHRNAVGWRSGRRAGIAVFPGEALTKTSRLE